MFTRIVARTLTVLTHPAAIFAFLLLLAGRGLAADVALTWDPVVNPAVTGYKVHHGPAAGNYTTSLDVGDTTSRTVTNLTEGATYHFGVTAYDAAGNQSAYSNDVVATIASAKPVADFSASTTSGPAPLAMNFVNSSTGVISTYAWTFGDGGVSAAQSPSHVYSTAGVYTVVLTVTGPGGSSTKTRANFITVTGTSDTSPPTTPSSLTATASGTATVNLAWTASTDNVGVTGYRVERCQGSGCTGFADVAIASATTHSNTGLLAGTTYRYRVRAGDAAGNLSGYTNIASVTTSQVPGSIAFVQVNYAVPQSPQTTVPVTFPQAQTAGNLNVVVVGWSDTRASVTSVTDSKGNVYTRAIGPTRLRGKLSQSIYYARNIAAAATGANTLTVKFNVPAASPDIRIVEYSGLDKVNPVDATAERSGTGVLAKSASVKTRNANDLLFGANTVTGATLSAGTWYTTRTITSPDGNIVEDRVVASRGSYSATASLSGGSWVMQMVAFKAAP